VLLPSPQEATDAPAPVVQRSAKEPHRAESKQFKQSIQKVRITASAARDCRNRTLTLFLLLDSTLLNNSSG
jgi:hypothetical protein